MYFPLRTMKLYVVLCKTLQKSESHVPVKKFSSGISYRLWSFPEPQEEEVWNQQREGTVRPDGGLCAGHCPRI